MNEEAKWFEPVPELEGDITEVNDATLQANIALVKEENADEDDEDRDDDLEWLLNICSDTLRIIMIQVYLLAFWHLITLWPSRAVGLRDYWTIQ